MAAQPISHGDRLHHLVFPERQVDEPTKRRRCYDDDYVSDDADDRQPKRLRRKDLAALSDWSLEVTDGEGFSKTFPVHRATLASASPFFHAAFTTPMRGRRASTSKLRLPPLCCAAFESALDFIYDGTLPKDEGLTWLCPWFAIARELDVPSLRDAALEQLHAVCWEDLDPTPECREHLMLLYAHAIQLGLEKLQHHCEQQLVASPGMRGAVETYDAFPAEAILRLAVEATQQSSDPVAETKACPPDRPSPHAWAAAVLRRRLCGDAELADGDVRALLDGLAGVWAQLWDMDSWSDKGRIDRPDEAVTLLRLSVEHQGGCFLSSAALEPITANETARESKDTWRPTEQLEQEALASQKVGGDETVLSVFPTERTFYGDKAKDFDESAVIFAAATLEFIAAEFLIMAGNEREERYKSRGDPLAGAEDSDQTDDYWTNVVTEEDILRALGGDVESGQSLTIHAGRCLQAQALSLACCFLGTVSTEALARLPFDVAVVIWESVLRKHCHEDVVFDSIRGYLEATSAGPEARARAWRTCSFAHLSATKMATVMENTDEFGLDSSTLLKASIAARFCAEGTSGGEAKAREYMQEAGLTFNERNTPPPWVPRATKVAGPDRGRRPLPYLEIGY